MSEKFTIEFDANDAKVAHIEGLQRIITSRNKQIERLTERLEAGEESEYAVKQYDRGYKAGYKAAAGELMEASKTAALALGNIRKDAFQIYLEGDKL